MPRGLSLNARECAAIAELACAAEDRAHFRRMTFERLDRSIGFDLGMFLSTADGVHHELMTHAYDDRTAREHIMEWMGELTAEELACAVNGPMIDVDILPARRRDFLSMYRELHRPHGVTVFTTSVWSNRFGGFGFQLARASKRGRFTPRQIALVSAVCPQLKLAEALWISNDQTSSSFDLSFEDWAEDCSLTTRERTVAQLVARGLKNPEIAALLGSSRLTVRNQIGAIFRKAGVSTRAELVFAAAAGRRCSAPSRGASARAKTAWLELVRSASG